MTGDSVAHTTLASLYGQVTHDFGPVTAALSAHHDDASSFGGLDIAQVSLSAPAGPLRLHASAGTGVKVPSLYQLFSFYGTAGLVPEKAVSLDAGADFATPHGTIGASVFSRPVRDLIDFVACEGARFTTQPYGYYANIDRSQAHGVELETRQDFGTVTVTANYSWLVTKNRSPGLEGNRLPRTPGQLGSADVTWHATDRLTFGAGVRHVGNSFDDAWNTRRLKAYTLADLRASYDITDRLSLYGRIENAGDTRYETAADYGQPGRRVWIGLRARIF
jgi:vitamin B12 transporter